MGKETPLCATLMHCWHVRSSTTDGLAEKGYDTLFCCWCGREATRKWRMARDTRHGPHAGLQKRVEDAPRVTPTGTGKEGDRG